MNRNTYIVLIFAVIWFSIVWGVVEAISGSPFDAAVTVYTPYISIHFNNQIGRK